MLGVDAGDSEAEEKKARGTIAGRPTCSSGRPAERGNRRKPAAGRKAMVKAWVWDVWDGVAWMW